MAKKIPVATSRPRERAFSVGVEIYGQDHFLSLDDSLRELELLATTAGLDVVGQATQKLQHPNVKTFIGPGKIEEVKALVEETAADVIIFDEKDRHKSLKDQLDFVNLLKSKEFDTVFLLHRSFSRTLICRLAGIPQRIGYYTKKRGFLLTHKIPMPDLRYAIRSLRATPIVSIVAILSLALGIGANTAIFSIIDSMMLRTLPVRDPQRLVIVDLDNGSWTNPLWEQIREVAVKLESRWSKESKLGAGARYVIKHYDKLTAYLDDPRLQPTNNLQERMLRTEKLIENSSMFRKSLEGRFVLDIIRTILQTAVAAGVPVHEYLVSVLRSDPDEVAQHPERFTPRAWAARKTSEQAS